jgi:hypothetical protein
VGLRIAASFDVSALRKEADVPRDLRKKLRGMAELAVMLGVVGAMTFPLIFVMLWPDFCETRPENILLLIFTQN